MQEDAYVLNRKTFLGGFPRRGETLMFVPEQLTREAVLLGTIEDCTDWLELYRYSAPDAISPILRR